MAMMHTIATTAVGVGFEVGPFMSDVLHCNAL